MGKYWRCEVSRCPGTALSPCTSTSPPAAALRTRFFRKKVELEDRVAVRIQELQATNQHLIELDDVNQIITATLRRNESHLRVITDTVPAFHVCLQ